MMRAGYSETARSLRIERNAESESWNALLQLSASSNMSEYDGSSSLSTAVKKHSISKLKSGKNAKSPRSAPRATMEGDGGNTTSQSQGEMQDVETMESPKLPSVSLGDTDMSIPDPPSLFPTNSNEFVRDDKLMLDTSTHTDKSANAIRKTPLQEDGMLDVIRRQKVCAALRAGNVEYVLQVLEHYYPSVLLHTDKGKTRNGVSVLLDTKDGKLDLLFRLRCQKFVELLLAISESPEGSMSVDEEAEDEEEQIASALILSRTSSPLNPKPIESTDDLQPNLTKASTMEDVLHYGAELNSLYSASSNSPDIQRHLNLVFSLVAYGDPRNTGSELSRLCDQTAREELAEEVNSAMLGKHFFF